MYSTAPKIYNPGEVLISARPGSGVLIHFDLTTELNFRSRYTLAVAKLSLELPNPSFGISRHESLSLASPQGAESYSL